MATNDPRLGEKEHHQQWPNDAGFNASTEIRTPIDLVVQGKIPACVAGILYRTGPGHYKVPDTPSGGFKVSHWFDGFTVIHRFQLIPQHDGTCKVKYNSRRQVDELLERVRKTGKLDGVSFGQKRDPCASFFQKLKGTFEPVRTADPYRQNVGVTITMNPSGIIRQSQVEGNPSNFAVLTTLKTIDMETLEPTGVTDQKALHPDLKGPMSGAHAQYDHENGDVLNYNLDFGKTATYRMFRTSCTNGETAILATISGASLKPAYIHSIFLSGEFVILAIWSSHITTQGVSILWERNLLDAMAFDPKSKVKWLVVDRKHGRGHVATFESPAAFSFHSVNAWQEHYADGSTDVNIVCDVIQFPNMDILHKVYYENLVSDGPGAAKWSGEALRKTSVPSLCRYRLSSIPTQASKKVKSPAAVEILFEVKSPLVGELPTINPLYSTRRHRYVYSLVDRGFSSFVDGICKFDTDTKNVTYWMTPKHTPGEAIFVPDPARKNIEDGGFLLSVILDGSTGTSYLLCLNAENMQEAGRAEVGIAVGLGFHGCHAAS